MPFADIVNNHKTWTIFNNKPVDATDSYAIRVAFAKAMAVGGADSMAIALENGHAVFETVADGKRSRIDFGHTLERLQERHDRSQALLNRL